MGPVGPVALVLLILQFWLTLLAVLVILAIQLFAIQHLPSFVSLFSSELASFHCTNAWLFLFPMTNLESEDEGESCETSGEGAGCHGKAHLGIGKSIIIFLCALIQNIM